MSALTALQSMFGQVYLTVCCLVESYYTNDHQRGVLGLMCWGLFPKDVPIASQRHSKHTTRSCSRWKFRHRRPTTYVLHAGAMGNVHEGRYGVHHASLMPVVFHLLNNGGQNYKIQSGSLYLTECISEAMGQSLIVQYTATLMNGLTNLVQTAPSLVVKAKAMAAITSIVIANEDKMSIFR